MEYIPDNYDMWVQHEAQQQAQLDKLPVCCECDEPIQTDEYYEINGECICPECLESNHRKWVEDYVQ